MKLSEIKTMEDARMWLKEQEEQEKYWHIKETMLFLDDAHYWRPIEWLPINDIPIHIKQLESFQKCGDKI